MLFFFFRILPFIIIVSSTPVNSFASEKEMIEPIFGTVNDSTNISPTYDNYCNLSSEGYRDKVEYKTLYVIGINECKQQYEKSTLFYEVAYRGKSYYVKTSTLSVKDEDIELIKSYPNDKLSAYKEIALVYSGKHWLDEVKKSINKLKATEKYGITINDASLYDMSEYTEGTGFNITFYNPTKKTIKYVTTNLVGYNPVGDPVKDYRRKSTLITLKGVGPIEPGSTIKYSMDYAWMTDLVETFKIKNIVIQYMDGTTKTVKSPDKITLSNVDTQNLRDFATKDENLED